MRSASPTDQYVVGVTLTCHVRKLRYIFQHNLLPQERFLSNLMSHTPLFSVTSEWYSAILCRFWSWTQTRSWLHCSKILGGKFAHRKGHIDTLMRLKNFLFFYLNDSVVSSYRLCCKKQYNVIVFSEIIVYKFLHKIRLHLKKYRHFATNN